MSTMIIKCKKRANMANVQDEHRQKLWSALWESSAESMAFFVVSFTRSAVVSLVFKALECATKITALRFSIGQRTLFDNEVNFSDSFSAQFLLSSRQNVKKEDQNLSLSPANTISNSNRHMHKCKHSHCLKRPSSVCPYNLTKPGKNWRRKKETEITFKFFVLSKKSFFRDERTRKNCATLELFVERKPQKTVTRSFSSCFFSRAQKRLVKRKHFALRFWYFSSCRLWKLEKETKEGKTFCMCLRITKTSAFQTTSREKQEILFSKASKNKK